MQKHPPRLDFVSERWDPNFSLILYISNRDQVYAQFDEDKIFHRPSILKNKKYTEHFNQNGRGEFNISNNIQSLFVPIELLILASIRSSSSLSNFWQFWASLSCWS